MRHGAVGVGSRFIGMVDDAAMPADQHRQERWRGWLGCGWGLCTVSTKMRSLASAGTSNMCEELQQVLAKLGDQAQHVAHVLTVYGHTRPRRSSKQRIAARLATT